MPSQPRFINILSRVVLASEDQIMRDLNELSLLQSGKNLPISFAEKLPQIVKSKIIDKASYLLPDYGIIYNGEIVNEPEEDRFVVLNILPEVKNLIRSLPFVSCSAFIANIDQKLSIKNIDAALLFLPAFNKILWADSEAGAFFENRKLKTSQVSEIERANICDRTKQIGLNFDSTSYEISLISEAKLDFYQSGYSNEFDFKAAEYIANLAGAVTFVDSKNKIVKIAANKELFDKF